MAGLAAPPMRPTPPPRHSLTLVVPLDDLRDAIADAVREALPSPEDRSPHEPLLDLKAVARRLSVSPRTVETLVAEGAIPVTRVRGQRRFTPAAVDAYVRTSSRRGAA